MPAIFLSYRRSDSPQACRVYEWLARRFGEDEVFMDVSAIPAAVDFDAFIREAIATSGIVVVLIGRGWSDTIQAPDDPVRREVEAALYNRVPLLPVLIGNTPMPEPEALPAGIASLAMQNAVTVGVSHDFHTHMQTLLPRVESLLGRMAQQTRTLADPDVISHACFGIVDYLRERFAPDEPSGWNVDWQVVGTRDFNRLNEMCVTLFMHRAVRLSELLELHFILSFWGHQAINEHRLAGWVMRQLEQAPVIPPQYLSPSAGPVEWGLKVRPSDEDPRQVWKMITDEPLRLSLAYVATVSPRRDAGEAVAQPLT